MRAKASSKGRLTDTSAQRMHLKTRKPSIWIRPRNLPIEIGALTYKVLSPPRMPKWKSLVRFVIDLLGVIILLASIWFFLSQTSMSSHIKMIQQGITKSQACALQNACAVNGEVSLAVSSKPSPGTTTGASLMPIITPTPGQNPSPASSPTPSVAVLSIPSSLTLSYALSCATGQPGLLILSNTGGAVLVWLEDKPHTSQQLSIYDPQKLYLIQPGKSATAYVKCSPTIAPGQYNLQILYNGGSSSVTVIITA